MVFFMPLGRLLCGIAINQAIALYHVKVFAVGRPVLIDIGERARPYADGIDDKRIALVMTYTRRA